MKSLTLDLFSGPRGWDVGGRELGIDAIGIEHDAAACATSRAAGFHTIRADVATYPLGHLSRVEGLIASPPCQAFSNAGDGAGRDWLPELHAHARRIVYGWEPWPYDTDPGIALVLEPLRWATALVPDWIALEQVPPVLELWRTFAEVFSALGWKCWTGILNAADYGVPQTRERAFLLAHRRKFPTPPEPTHCKGGAQTMFGELSPWVSMADALGWGMTDRPIVTVAAGHTRGTVGGGGGGRGIVERERDEGRWKVQYRRGGDRLEEERSAALPSTAITSRANRWQVRDTSWAFRSPSTTVAADPRITARCHHDEGSQGRDAKTTAQVRAGDYDGTEPIKLTVHDALILQSFPADYPVQGTKTKRFEQIGNAVPPRLAKAVLASLQRGAVA